MSTELIERFKYHVFKRSRDSDLYKVYKLSKSVSYRKMKQIKIKSIRSSTISTRYDSIYSYINSMKLCLRHIKKGEVLEDKSSLKSETRRVYLDDWLEINKSDSESLLKFHNLIRKLIIEIIDEIYKYQTKDKNLFSYYKRLNTLHFQQLAKWTDAVDDMTGENQ